MLGDRRIIDMRVRREATLEEVVLNTRRRRRHQTDLLKDIEIELRREELKYRERKCLSVEKEVSI